MKQRWPTWLLLIGLTLVFVAGRVLVGMTGVRLPVLLVGAGLVVAATFRSVVLWRTSEGDARRVHGVFALTSVGCALALVGFLFGTVDGLAWLDLDFEGIRQEARFRRVSLVLSSILLVCSLLPLLAARWALGRGGRPLQRVDALRVRETAANTASLALAVTALMLVGYIAAARNQTIDFSYFKTSRPGDAVQEIVRQMDEPIRAALFFPTVNPVKDEVRTYFETLRAETDNVVIEEYDRFADPEAAEDFEVRSDGDVVLRIGDRTERIGLPVDLVSARGRLRVMDRQVQQSLLMLTRERRVAYLTAGHGELSDPLTVAGEGTRPSADPPYSALRQLLELLNYEVRDIGVQRGLGDRIPDDAAMVMILGPAQPFLESEMAAVRDYADRGGSLLVALEAGSEFRLDLLGDQLGVDVDTVMVLDDRTHMRETGGVTDRRLTITNQFSPHPSVTTASRQGVGSGVLMIGAAGVTPREDAEGLRSSVIVRSLPSGFADRNGNFRFDEGLEERGSSGLAAAVERDGTGDAKGMRALVFGDAEIFGDDVLRSLRLNTALVADGVRWLGGEEDFAGEVVSEEDVPIVHTRSEDVVWFYAIIFGAPALVLVAGIVSLYGRRRAQEGVG